MRPLSALPSALATFALGSIAFVLAPHAGAQDQVQGEERCVPGDGQVALRGVVLDDRTSVPLQRADVVITWTVPGSQDPERVEMETDRQGRFEACDLPSARIMRTVAEFWGQSSGRVQTSALEPGESHELELTLTAPTGELTGRVVDDEGGGPVVEATVSLGYPALTARTDREGSFRIPAAPPGHYDMQVDHLAFASVNDSVEVSYGDRTILSVRMATATIVLDPIRVEVRSILLEESGFYRRMERGQGVYLTRSDIQQRIPLYPSDALRGIAGVNAVQSRGRPGYVLVDRNQCPYRYVFNGTTVGEGFQIDDIPVDWIEALEVYRGISTLPGEFEGAGIRVGGHCGVIVIWTRNIP